MDRGPLWSIVYEGYKESDMTEQAYTHTHTHTHTSKFGDHALLSSSIH